MTSILSFSLLFITHSSVQAFETVFWFDCSGAKSHCRLIYVAADCSSATISLHLTQPLPLIETNS